MPGSGNFADSFLRAPSPGAIRPRRTSGPSLLLLAPVLLWGAQAPAATIVNSGVDTYVDSFDGVQDTTGSTSGVQIPDLRDTCFGAPGLACAGTDSMDGRDPAAGADNADSGGISGDGLYGIKWDTNIGNTSSINEGLLWFDISSQTLADFDAATSAVATLRYNVHDNGSTGNLYRMTSDWLSGANGGNSVTWNSLGGGVIPGTNAAAVSSGTMIATDNDGTYTLDVTADVAAWASGSASNFGWGIEAAGGTRVRLNTFENADDALKPTLLLQSYIAGTSFEEAGVGDKAFSPSGGDTELGFSRMIDADGNGTFGDEDTGGNAYYGVQNTGVAFPATDGSQAYEVTGNTAQAVERLTFDTVDTSSKTGVSFLIDVFIASANWEVEDYLKIALSADNGTAVDVLSVLDTTGNNHESAINVVEGSWRTYSLDVPDVYESLQLVIESSNYSSSGGEKYFFDNIRFLGDLPTTAAIPEPTTGLLLGLGLVGLATQGRRRTA